MSGLIGRSDGEEMCCRQLLPTLTDERSIFWYLVSDHDNSASTSSFPMYSQRIFIDDRRPMPRSFFFSIS